MVKKAVNQDVLITGLPKPKSPTVFLMSQFSTHQNRRVSLTTNGDILCHYDSIEPSEYQYYATFVYQCVV